MKLITLWEKYTGFVTSAILCLLMSITFVDVVGRTFFSSPLLGAAELTQVLMASMIFLLLPEITWRQEHITVDLIDSVSGRILDLVRNVLTGVLGTALFGVMAYRLWRKGDTAVSYGDSTSLLEIPVAPFFYGMSVLAAVTAIFFFVLLFSMKTREHSAELEAAYKMAEQTDAPASGSSKQAKD